VFAEDKESYIFMSDPAPAETVRVSLVTPDFLMYPASARFIVTRLTGNIRRIGWF
jgi:hypothetical protein